MRKIVMLNRISIDGFFAGPNGEIDWFVHDPEVDKAAHEMMDPDTLLFGRETFQMFESYWPHVEKNPNASQGDQFLAEELSQMTKVVFTKTLKAASWVNTELTKNNLITEAKKLKQAKGADITIFGSGTLVQQLSNEGLIDEYLFIVTPVVLGMGKPLFTNVGGINLELLETRRFTSGNVLLRYRLDK